MCFLKNIYNCILDYIFPRYCVLCNKYLQKNTPYSFLCMKCANCFSTIGSDICDRCGNPFFTGDFYSMDSKNCKLCFKCKENKPIYQTARSAFKINKFAKKFIYQFKYQNSKFLVCDMAKLCLKNQQFMDLISNAILVPVPLHWRKKLMREYNQSECFATELCKYAKTSKVINLLRKHKHTKPQVGLLAEERLVNLNRAFSLRKCACKIDKLTKIVIIDDVLTTGATLSQCALVLKNHGFKNVHIASFVRT